jgi:hypothetical protein
MPGTRVPPGAVSPIESRLGADHWHTKGVVYIQIGEHWKIGWRPHPSAGLRLNANRIAGYSACGTVVVPLLFFFSWCAWIRAR